LPEKGRSDQQQKPQTMNTIVTSLRERLTRQQIEDMLISGAEFVSAAVVLIGQILWSALFFTVWATPVAWVLALAWLASTGHHLPVMDKPLGALTINDIFGQSGSMIFLANILFISHMIKTAVIYIVKSPGKHT
jgi:hypothetical protein